MAWRGEFVGRIKWSADIVSDLVVLDNPTWGITNSDLELTELVLQESYFTLACTHSDWHAPLTGSDNTPTVSWCYMDAYTVNPIVADLLRVCDEMNSGSLLTSSMFYHPGPLNTMADDASRRFDFPDNNFISYIRSKYCPSQSAGSWTLCHPPTEITLCVIYVLCRRMSRLETLPTTIRP